MNHYGAVIKQDPAALTIAFDAGTVIGKIIFQLVVDFFTHSMELPAACSRGEHEIIENRSQLAHVENDNVGARVRRGLEPVGVGANKSGGGYDRDCSFVIEAGRVWKPETDETEHVSTAEYLGLDEPAQPSDPPAEEPSQQEDAKQ